MVTQALHDTEPEFCFIRLLQKQFPVSQWRNIC